VFKVNPSSVHRDENKKKIPQKKELIIVSIAKAGW
jgi:hypothetical protein